MPSDADTAPSVADLAATSKPPKPSRPAGTHAAGANSAAAAKQQSAQSLPAKFAAPAQTASIGPSHEASLLSLLCLIAGSVLASSNNDLAAQIGAECLRITAASAATSAPAKDDAPVEPDPPEVVPEDPSTDKAASKPDQSSPAEPAPAAKCKNCAANVGSATTELGQTPAAAIPTTEAAAPDHAAPAEQIVAGESADAKTASVEVKPAAEAPSSDDDKPAPVDKPAPAAATPAEPPTLTGELAPSDETTPPPGTATPPAAENEPAAAAGENAAENAVADNAAADGAVVGAVATEETAKPEESTTKPLELPDWFLGNNVVLYEDLTKRQSILQLFKANAKSKPDSNTDVAAAKAGDSEADGKTDEKSTQVGVANENGAAATPDSTATEKVCTCKTAATAVSDATEKTEKESAPAQKPTEAAGSSTPKPVYQLHQDIYDEGLDLLSAALQPPANVNATDVAKKASPESWIAQSSFLLQSPRDGSLEFLDEVVRQVGRDAGADLIMLELDDLEDLCYHFWHDSEEVRAVGPKYLTSPLRMVGEFFGYSKPEEKSKEGVACILAGADRKRESQAKTAANANGSEAASAGKATEAPAGNAIAVGDEKPPAAAAAKSQDAADILQAGVKDAFDAATKILQAAIREAFSAPKPENGAALSSASSAAAAVATQNASSNHAAPATAEKETSPAKPRPLILLFRNVESVGKQTPLQRLCEGVNKLRREQGVPVVIVGTAVSNSTSENKPTASISKAWDGLHLDDSTVINVSPRNTKRAAEALKRHGARTKPRATWRLLRRSVRVTLDQHPAVSVDALYPSGPPAGEQVVDELEDEKRRQTLADWDDALSARVVRQVSARAVRTGAVTPADVFDVMERVMRNRAILDKMGEAGDDEFVAEDGDSDEHDVEFGGPAKKSRVKPLLDSISESCSDAEREYFDCVIDTDALSSTAQDIHMDQSLMDSLKQLLSLRTSKPYGLLAKEAINGAILYGPPGTGKTHLARVVAASSRTNLIVATPADIQNMWVGETEKRIKALFSLGTKLAPCVIFLDEGDSVFGRRGAGDRDWQRKAMSQFLMEMDGLVSRKKAPFLILATNRPGDLDEAVCRRLPHTLHIGMPTARGRRAILDIYLKDEKLDKGLNLDEVASDSMTKGFSGSDIRTLCVQAAMAAHKALEADKKDGAAKEDEAAGSQKRVINMEHFRKALERTRPSVTRESLMEIERFTGQQESVDHQSMYI